MKKVISLVFAVILGCTMVTSNVLALDEAPNMGNYTQDGEGLAQCYSDYMEYYIFGISRDPRELIKEHVKEGYTNGTIQMMPLMSAFTNLRKAGQIGETAENQVNGVKPTVDVVKKYYTLTDEQKTAFESFIVQALSAVGLSAVIADGTVVIQKGSDNFAEITLVTEKPKSATRIYLDAYIPGLTDAEKTVIETLVSEYSAEGGSPGGSGTLWRCIREIGELMGVEAAAEVDMESGTMKVVVSKEGEKYLKNCSKEVQEAVIAKADEGMTAIGLATEYKNGVYKILKNGTERLSHTVIPAPVKSATRIYLDAYIPGLTDAEKTVIETLVSEYSAEGGTPSGSGTLWRCIREIGELMGVKATAEVDMESGTMKVVVTKEGEKYLKSCSKEVQNAVIAKAKEGVEAIGCTSEYKDGVFTVKKAGTVRLAHTVLDNANENDDSKNDTPDKGKDGSSDSTPDRNKTKNGNDGDDSLHDNPSTGDNNNIMPLVLVVCVLSAVLFFTIRRKNILKKY